MTDETDDIRCQKCGIVSLGCNDADCPETTAGLLVGEVLPAEEDTFDVWFEQYRMQTWLSAGCDKDRGPEPSAAWGLGSRQSLLRGWLARAALTPHTPAQAIIERLEAKLQEQALQYLSDNGQWIEETERLTRERDEAVAEAKEIRARWNDAENEFAALKAKQVADIPAGGLAEEAGPAPAKIPTLAEKPAYATSTRGRADPLYAMACQVVRASKRGSISLVQRHLRIGYNRAAGLLEAMVGDVIAEMPPTTKIIKLPAAMAASIPLQEGDHDGNGY